ncbi:hypothetical protein THRCLA_23067 [Thraustotheca clavata]|uniref:Uncharacterized protein n=1 Tax=Thraustotheca clavata TaxID=74557 RepID=A0A1V9YGD0_9STRA|nr:hypothetical protein THRCLA_23067 [Thraustotheca clavata]
MSGWVTMLGRVLDEFQRICHYIEGHSGPSCICGWISVFCIFKEDMGAIPQDSHQFNCFMRE